MAGAYIAMGTAVMVSVMAGTELTLGSGFSRLIGGMVFPLGVILTVLCGAELFTGDAMLAPMAAWRYNTGYLEVFRLWLVVWLGNLIGSIFFASLMSFGPLVSVDQSGSIAVTTTGLSTIALATERCGYLGFATVVSTFWKAVACGWLLNLAVLLAICADDALGKILGIWFPVMGMSAGGLEHAVTNMYLIPAGLLTATRLSPLEVSRIGPDISNLGFIEMWTNNLIPVTIGNLLGGLICTGFLMWIAFRQEITESDSSE